MMNQTDRIYEAFFEEDALPYCDLAMAREFLADVAVALPQDQRSVIEQTFLQALKPETPPAIQQEIIQKVAAMAHEAKLWQPFAFHDRRVLAEPIKPFSDIEEGRCVLFVVTTPYFVILREAMYLRRNGYRVFLLSLSPIPAKLAGMFEEHFDGLAHSANSFRLMRAMLKELRPQVVHVQCWMWMYVLGRLAIESCAKSSVVCEFYDATSMFAEREDLVKRWDARLVDLDFALEKFIMNNAGAVISRYSPEAAAQWASRHDATPKYMEFQPYPCCEFIHYAKGRPSQDDGVIRLVHAGSFLPIDADHPPTLFPEISMPSVFRRLLEQGFALDVFMEPHSNLSQLGPGYDAYRALERDFELFRLLEGVAPDCFAKAISTYDYGILLFDYDPQAARLSPLWMQACMPTRFFSFLEAGLPAIVIADYENMANFLEENGLGLGIAPKDYCRLSEILTDFDREKAGENVRRYNETHGMNTEIKRLMNLYDELGS